MGFCGTGTPDVDATNRRRLDVSAGMQTARLAHGTASCSQFTAGRKVYAGMLVLCSIEQKLGKTSKVAMAVQHAMTVSALYAFPPLQRQAASIHNV